MSEVFSSLGRKKELQKQRDVNKQETFDQTCRERANILLRQFQEGLSNSVSSIVNCDPDLSTGPFRLNFSEYTGDFRLVVFSDGERSSVTTLVAVDLISCCLKGFFASSNQSYSVAPLPKEATREIARVKWDQKLDVGLASQWLTRKHFQSLIDATRK